MNKTRKHPNLEMSLLSVLLRSYWKPSKNAFIPHHNLNNGKTKKQPSSITSKFEAT